MLLRVALVRTEVPVESSAPTIRVTRIGEVGTTLAVNSNRVTLRKMLCYYVTVNVVYVTVNVIPSSPILVSLMTEAPRSPGTSGFTRVTKHNIPKDGILQSHCHENLKSCTV
jgi:hypothetical protein